ncbi:Heparinase II/III-like protein [Salipiger profundus]|uniref:Heparinase II/III-like protein n=1 Tax=Salipiger profundus TaxID=1229727 RepID=A0A1U7CZW9_9RHOB|nr:Heparinase II/III-like protein [Salipiger profundus]
MLELGFDGRSLSGEDLLMTLDDADRKRFDRRMDEARLAGLPWQLRFHLHPEVDAELDMGGHAVSMALRSGEVWVFRTDQATELTLEPSVYLEKGRLRPRAAKQVVLSGRAMEYATRIRWSLAKAQDTAIAVRDLVTEDAEPTH